MPDAYNHNVLKEAAADIRGHPDTEFFVIGEYGRRWFTQKKLPMADSFRYTAQNPSTYRAQQIARDLLDRFASGEIDRLCVIYTDSKGMSEVVRQTQLLPLRRQSFSVKSGEEQPEPTFEFVPTMEAVLDKLVRQLYLRLHLQCARRQLLQRAERAHGGNERRQR